MLLETRHIVMLSDSVSMPRYRIGVWGFPVASRECILLVGRDAYGWEAEAGDLQPGPPVMERLTARGSF
jgi:hypothetical protein